MPLDPCDYCCPANWRDPESARASLGRAICDIVNALGGGGGSQDVNLIEVGGAPIALGQTTMAGSIPVTIASDQGPFDVNVFEYGGVATSLGQKLMAASVPVTIASDQSAVPVSGTVTTAPATNGTSTVTVSTTSAAASTTANIRSLSIANVGGVSGTVDGDAFEAGATLTLSAILDPVTNTYLRVPAIAYSAVGTTFRIVEVA